ncbi:M85 family metallopeptidase [Caballeronia sp. LZ065]|uniref:M85 family metallopeptidase n=1 Tax=Caballeronia sp. LZ065 TaxID=3038571 RepID=UPI002867A921|nr:M85 family metallopeptidase [Caballeronia sp. LZ065]MDR5782045.1 M85 family metallopeptidase [Caballeronia sp. LZ065]
MFVSTANASTRATSGNAAPTPDDDKPASAAPANPQPADNVESSETSQQSRQSRPGESMPPAGDSEAPKSPDKTDFSSPWVPTQAQLPSADVVPSQAQAPSADLVPTRMKREDTDAPAASSDAYADYVVAKGKANPLSESELNDARWGAMRAAQNSHSRLMDTQTADMIGNTMLDALRGSATFRNMMSFGLHHGGEPLGDIGFRNRYYYTPQFRGDFRNIREMTSMYLRLNPATSMPLSLYTSAQSRTPEQSPYVNISAAPNENSMYLDAWRVGLIHEIAHLTTNSRDPDPDAPQASLGPTELLALRVATEMGWQTPNFTSYGSDERSYHHQQVQRAALIDAAERNGAHARAFFERLDVLASNQDASPDFYELGEPRPGTVAHDHTYFQPAPAGPSTSNSSSDVRIPDAAVPHNVTQPLPEQRPNEDLARAQFSHGEPLLFRFTQSAPLGPPAGFRSAWAASSASWDTQGRFFRYGNPVDGNPHVRQFDFEDGSKAVIWAYQPQLANSDGTNVEKGAIGVGATIVGAVAGAVAGGPGGAVAGGSIGAAVGAAAAAKVPYDRIWQPYWLDYYYKGATRPFYSQYMYAWDSDSRRVNLLAQQANANLYPDYADSAPDHHWSFWRWRSGDTPLRH